jgi:predicted Zn-dependent peptidase
VRSRFATVLAAAVTTLAVSAPGAGATSGLQSRTLPNGVRILLHPRTGAKALTFAIQVGAGSLEDRPGKEGVAHLIEHMFFEGGGGLSPRQINEELDAQGGAGNAFTDQASITFLTQAPTREARNAMRLYTTIFTHPSSDPVRLAKEKRIVEGELRNDFGDRFDQADLETGRLLLGDQPLSSDPGGTVAAVRTATPADIRSYIERYFTGANTTVLLDGDPRHFDLRLLRRTLGRLPPGGHVDQANLFQGFRPGALSEVVSDRSESQAHLDVQFPGLPYDDPLAPAAQVAGIVIGGGSSSRLNERLREHLGLTYDVSAQAESFPEYGDFDIATDVDPRNLARATGEIFKVLRGARRSIAPAEVARAKRQAINQILLNSDDPKFVTELALDALTEGRPIQTPESLIRRFRAVTRAQVHAAAQRITDFGQAKLLVHGPVRDDRPLRAGLRAAGLQPALGRVAFDPSFYETKLTP